MASTSKLSAYFLRIRRAYSESNQTSRRKSIAVHETVLAPSAKRVAVLRRRLMPLGLLPRLGGRVTWYECGLISAVVKGLSKPIARVPVESVPMLSRFPSVEALLLRAI